MTYNRYRRPDMTPLWYLIGLNVVLFLVSLFEPAIIGDFGLIPFEAFHRPWTIVAAMFLHGGVGHILGNMLTLYFFGSATIEILGRTGFLVVYFVGGIVGNLFYILLGPSLSIAVGASGAIFALGGALVALIPRNKVLVFPIPVPVPLWVAVIGGFLVVTFLPGVAWESHLGGLLTGLVAVYLFRRRRRSC